MGASREKAVDLSASSGAIPSCGFENDAISGSSDWIDSDACLASSRSRTVAAPSPPAHPASLGSCCADSTALQSLDEYPLTERRPIEPTHTATDDSGEALADAVWRESSVLSKCSVPCADQTLRMDECIWFVNGRSNSNGDSTT